MAFNSPHRNEYELRIAQKRAFNKQREQECLTSIRSLFPNPVTSKLPKPSQRKIIVKGALPARASGRLASKPAPNYADFSPEVTTHGRATLARLRAEVSPMSTSAVGAQPAGDAVVAELPLCDRAAKVLGYTKLSQGWTHKNYGPEKATEIVEWCVNQW